MPPGWPGQQPLPPVPYPPPAPPNQPPPPYPGYPPGGYGYIYPGVPALIPPGVIPLRPLLLIDIFNGAVAYVRANPKATLGLTTVIVMITTVLGFVFNLLMTTTDGSIQELAGAATGAIAALLATTLLSGMLTVIVARSVTGVRITAAEAWQRVRGRMATLVGLTLLEVLAAVLLAGAVVLVIGGVARSAGGVVAALIGVPVVLAALAAFAYLATTLAMAPMAVVLEHKNIPDAIRRSLALARGRFWRLFGTLLLAGMVAVVIAGAISVPFDIAGSVVSLGSGPRTPTLGGTMVATIGQAISQILITPFLAGVITLLYTDARIRSEAFDFTLLSVRAGGADADGVWLSR